MALSLKWHIQLWHSLILFVILTTLGIGAYQYEKAHRIDAVDEQLIRLVPLILGPGGTAGKDSRKRREPRGERPPMDAQSTMPTGWEQRDPGSSFQVMGVPDRRIPAGLSPMEFFNQDFVPLGFYLFIDFKGNREDLKSDGFPDLELPSAVALGPISRTRNGQYREYFHETPSAKMFSGYDLEKLSSRLNLLKWQIAGVLFAIFVLSLLVGNLVVARSIRSLQEITKTTRSIASAKLDARVPPSRKTDAAELQSLTADLNHAFTQLEDLFSRQKRFTADASHELRTPLTALLAQLDRGLNRPRDEAEHRRVLELSKRSANRIRRITEQLLELARYDSGSIQMELESVSLGVMLQSLAEELAPYVQENGSRLEIDIEVPEAEVTCDLFRIEQVLTNLINNALQHNTKPVVITLRGRVETGAVILEVEDNGKGIESDNIDKLFDRFFQESRSRTHDENRANVGLGLSVAQAIIQAHKGTITVTSEPGIRTRFTISIPQSSLSLK